MELNRTSLFLLAPPGCCLLGMDLLFITRLLAMHAIICYYEPSHIVFILNVPLPSDP
jgi:hypothetical protein